MGLMVSFNQKPQQLIHQLGRLATQQITKCRNNHKIKILNNNSWASATSLFILNRQHQQLVVGRSKLILLMLMSFKGLLNPLVMFSHRLPPLLWDLRGRSSVGLMLDLILGNSMRLYSLLGIRNWVN
jgi:hypothetical protein